ncbi:MAG: hypothetical protein C0618_00390 [Desulfuromonas sp.]|nr:MAG: hypothetical protein C0618_00390 [Desulfuromonas sp.]
MNFLCRHIPHLVLVLLLFGCAMPPAHTSSARFIEPASKATAKLSIYLAPVGDCPGNPSLQLDSIELFDGESWLRLVDGPVSYEYQQLKGRQVLLAFIALPPGEYRKARLHVSGLEQGTGSVSSQGVTLTLPISRNLSLTDKDSKCLFLDWHLGDCYAPASGDVPRLSLRGQASSVSGENVYIVADKIRTLYIASGDRHFITSAIGFPGQLKDVRYDRARNRVYLLSQRPHSIYVLDGASYKVVDRVSLSSLIGPAHLELSADGRFAFVTDSAAGRLVKVDLQRRAVVEDSVLGVAPGEILYIEDEGRQQLAISSKFSQQVYLVNPETLAVTAVLPVDISPSGLLFNSERLYVCDTDSNAILVFDLRKRTLIRRINVALAPVSLVDDEHERIFAGHAEDNSLSVIAPQQFAVQRRIRLDAPTADLAYFQSRQILYVAHRDSGRISVVDVSAEKKIAEMNVGAAPVVVVIQQ